MPYFIYKIKPGKELENIGSFVAYKEARSQVRELRAESREPEISIRMIYAENPLQAEKLLLTPREQPVEGDD